MFKIKSGELKPQSGFVVSRSAGQEERVSTEPLAALGIEFNSVVGNNNKSQKGNISNFNKPSNPNNKSEVLINKNQQVNKDSKPVYIEKKKHTGPSPLLRGLLEKIAKGNKEEKIQNEKFEIKEEVKPIQKPISLSELKKPENTINKPIDNRIIREASEEKKSSLKDVLSKFSVDNTKKVEQVVEIKIPEKVETPKIEEKIIEEIKKEEPKIDMPAHAGEIKKPEDNNSWQKRKVVKEVPEDVLRKVLE